MDVATLQSQPTTAKLFLGDIGETVPKFLDSAATLPLGFVAFDLDCRSSTAQALRIFVGAAATRLPRVFCYFDDIIWPETACHNERVGELCAIRDLNSRRQDVKLAPLHLLGHMRRYPETWNDQIFVLHDFQHPLYCVNVLPQGGSSSRNRSGATKASRQCSGPNPWVPIRTKGRSPTTVLYDGVGLVLVLWEKLR
jgi:hypothetical protein